MLDLTRRMGEEIVVGNGNHIAVPELEGDRVRLGTTAPESVRVDRAEVHDRRQMSSAVPAAQKQSRAEAAPGASRNTAPDRCLQPDLAETIRRLIVERVRVRIRNVEIEMDGNRLVVGGVVPSDYLKQLVLQGVLDIVGAPAAGEVEFKVQVAESPR